MVNPSGKYIYSEAPISLIITTIVVLLMNPAGDELKNISDEMSFKVSKLFMFVSWYFSAIDLKNKANIIVETSDFKMKKKG